MKLNKLPESGKFILVHPDSENLMVQAEEFADLDYMLNKFVPRDKLFLVDIDEFWRKPCHPFL